jgi:hypothetical protein
VTDTLRKRCPARRPPLSLLETALPLQISCTGADRRGGTPVPQSNARWCPTALEGSEDVFACLRTGRAELGSELELLVCYRVNV